MPTPIAVRVQNMRKLAEEMRKHAGETELPVYVELMLRTARQLEREANRLERDGPYRHQQPSVRHAPRSVPSEH